MRWLALLLFTPAAWAFSTSPPTAQLTWDYPDPLPETVDGFRLYCAGALVWEGAEYPVTLSDTAMVQGRQDCYVTAYNALDESEQSNVVDVKYVTGRPVPPAGLRTQ